MFKQYNSILRHLGMFNFNSRLFFKNRNYARSIHLGVTYLRHESNAIKYLQRDKPLNMKALNNVYKKIDFGTITSDEGNLLLQCCGSLTYNSSQKERDQMCQNVYGTLVKHNKLNLNIYHTYIQICTENKTLLNSETFLDNLNSDPNPQTYKLLFENVCECGDENQAFILLERMKNTNISVDENVFNNLVLVHTLNGGIGEAEKVLATMKAAQVLETIQTHISILKGVIRRKNHQDFKTCLEKYPIILDENEVLGILRELGLNQSVNWIPELKNPFSQLEVTRDFINKLKNVCIHLVHMGQTDSAIKMFSHFQQEPEENYGFFILREMLLSNLDTNTIISTAQHFCDSGLNEYVFENLTEVALRNKHFHLAWRLFEHLKELRPHFFWPLFLDAKKAEGEAGVIKLLNQINQRNVTLDLDTLEHYIIPFCNREDAPLLIEKLKKTGFTVKAILGSLLRVLLKEGKVKAASELCEQYSVQIVGDKLFHLICESWMDSPYVVRLLQKYCEWANAEDDLVGEFLVRSLRCCKSKPDFREFLRALKCIREAQLKITTTTADSLRESIQEKLENTNKELSEEILDQIDQILEFRLKVEKNYIPHPRTMDVEELECHLVELLEKGMETRGVLRRLIQMHVNLGNTQRVEELRKQFTDGGYEETLGMKSSLMYNYTKNENFEGALNIYKELRQLDPKFSIDHYKKIDLAALLVKNDRISEAMEIIEDAEERLINGSESIQKNCVQLLNSFKDEKEQKAMFDLLLAKGFCKINNIMLGPLVRIFLTRGDLEQATRTYIEFVEKYKHTPLQFELIRDIAQSKNEELLQKVLNVSTEVRGAVSTQVMLIAVFAELSEENILRKLFATTQIPIQNELKKRCERWIKEGKADALLTLANSCDRVSTHLVDIDFIYQCIIKTFALNNDCAGAVRFYENLLEKDVPVDKKLESELYRFLRVNNYSVPDSLRLQNNG